MQPLNLWPFYHYPGTDIRPNPGKGATGNRAFVYLGKMLWILILPVGSMRF